MEDLRTKYKNAAIYAKIFPIINIETDYYIKIIDHYKDINNKCENDIICIKYLLDFFINIYNKINYKDDNEIEKKLTDIKTCIFNIIVGSDNDYVINNYLLLDQKLDKETENFLKKIIRKFENDEFFDNQIKILTNNNIKKFNEILQNIKKNNLRKYYYDNQKTKQLLENYNNEIKKQKEEIKLRKIQFDETEKKINKSLEFTINKFIENKEISKNQEDLKKQIEKYPKHIIFQLKNIINSQVSDGNTILHYIFKNHLFSVYYYLTNLINYCFISSKNTLNLNYETPLNTLINNNINNIDKVKDFIRDKKNTPILFNTFNDINISLFKVPSDDFNLDIKKLVLKEYSNFITEYNANLNSDLYVLSQLYCKFYSHYQSLLVKNYDKTAEINEDEIYCLDIENEKLIKKYISNYFDFVNKKVNNQSKDKEKKTLEYFENYFSHEENANQIISNSNDIIIKYVIENKDTLPDINKYSEELSKKLNNYNEDNKIKDNYCIINNNIIWLNSTVENLFNEFNKKNVDLKLILSKLNNYLDKKIYYNIKNCDCFNILFGIVNNFFDYNNEEKDKSIRIITNYNVEIKDNKLEIQLKNDNDRYYNYLYLSNSDSICINDINEKIYYKDKKDEKYTVKIIQIPANVDYNCISQTFENIENLQELNVDIQEIDDYLQENIKYIDYNELNDFIIANTNDFIYFDNKNNILNIEKYYYNSLIKRKTKIIDKFIITDIKNYIYTDDTLDKKIDQEHNKELHDYLLSLFNEDQLKFLCEKLYDLKMNSICKRKMIIDNYDMVEDSKKKLNSSYENIIKNIIEDENKLYILDFITIFKKLITYDYDYMNKLIDQNMHKIRCNIYMFLLYCIGELKNKQNKILELQIITLILLLTIDTRIKIWIICKNNYSTEFTDTENNYYNDLIEHMKNYDFIDDIKENKNDNDHNPDFLIQNHTKRIIDYYNKNLAAINNNDDGMIEDIDELLSLIITNIFNDENIKDIVYLSNYKYNIIYKSLLNDNKNYIDVIKNFRQKTLHNTITLCSFNYLLYSETFSDFNIIQDFKNLLNTDENIININNSELNDVMNEYKKDEHGNNLTKKIDNVDTDINYSIIQMIDYKTSENLFNKYLTKLYENSNIKTINNLEIQSYHKDLYNSNIVNILENDFNEEFDKNKNIFKLFTTIIHQTIKGNNK
jgi:hypothetical protein